MTATATPRIIALEEHYVDAELAAHYTGLDAPGPMREKLEDLGALRLAEMDAAGIDLQVIAHAAPGLQKLRADVSVPLARRVNDRLHAAVRAHPDRFAAFAGLPTDDPEAAAAELRRCVTELGFCGAMLHGLANGVFLDDRRFWPIFAAAGDLGVPIYIHPAIPHPPVLDAYYRDYLQDYPMVVRAAWGYTVEAATQAVRLVLSGVFQAHPGLQIILGHLGEGLPFLMPRIDSALSRPGQKGVQFMDTFRSHFHITTSGFFSDSALSHCLREMGEDRVMFSVDWPFEPNGRGTEWLNGLTLPAEVLAKLRSGNAERLLRLRPA